MFSGLYGRFLTARWHADIPAHTYQATFEPNKEWSTFYAKSPEIHKYWTHVVDKYGCREYMKLKHRVTEVVWDETISKWRLQVNGTHARSGMRY
jgi:cation diffusion facilitator CzcD-associated flavoprotein CzcO